MKLHVKKNTQLHLFSYKWKVHVFYYILAVLIEDEVLLYN